MNDSQIGILRASSIGLLLQVTLACAGTDKPDPTEDQARALRDLYGRGTPVAAAGSAGAAGEDNSGGSSSTANGGDGGEDEPGSGGTESGSGGTEATEAGGASGSGGETGGTSGSTGSSDCDGLALLQRSCGLSGCHVAASGFLSPFADADANPADFVGEAAVAACGDEILFVPSAPEDSIVIQKAQGTASCGGPMPPDGTPDAPPLSDEEIACVQEWIGTL